MAKRKGLSALSVLTSAGLGFVVIAIVIAVGSLILAEIENSTTDTTAKAVMTDGLGALSTIADWLGIIAIVVVAVVVILLVQGGFRGLGGMGGE